MWTISRFLVLEENHSTEQWSVRLAVQASGSCRLCNNGWGPLGVSACMLPSLGEVSYDYC
jgi:hypothetical protein